MGRIRLQKEAIKKHKEENAGKLADVIRGQRVNLALNMLKFDAKHASNTLEKLLMTAIADWQAQNEDVNIEDADLVVKEVFVDGGRQLKRLRPAPQGRAHRIRKRSNHVTITVADANENNVQSEEKDNK